MRSHEASERQQERNQNGYHGERSLSVGAGNFNRGNAYGIFSRDRDDGDVGIIPSPLPRHRPTRPMPTGVEVLLVTQ
jgi:hypothetical protein